MNNNIKAHIIQINEHEDKEYRKVEGNLIKSNSEFIQFTKHISKLIMESSFICYNSN